MNSNDGTHHHEDELSPEVAQEIHDMVQTEFAKFLAATERQAMNRLTQKEIASLPDDELDDRVWLRLSTLVESSDSSEPRRQDPDVAAYLATRLFEWEVANGGLHQFFFNHPDPELLKVILEGYSQLGLAEVREMIEHVIAPVVAEERAWRESLHDGTMETFSAGYSASQLPSYDDRIDNHDAVRIQLIRSSPRKFAR